MTTKGVSFFSPSSSSVGSSPPKPKTQGRIQQAAGAAFRGLGYFTSFFSRSAWRQTAADLASPYDFEIASPYFDSAQDFEQQVQEKIAEQRKQQSKVVEVDDGGQAQVDGAKPKSQEEARGWAIIAVLQKHVSVNDQELQKQYNEALIKHLPTELPDDDDHDTREKGQADAYKLAGMDVIKSLAKRAGVPDEWCFPSDASPVEAIPEVTPEIESEESESEEETTKESSSSSESVLVPVGRSKPTSELSQPDQSQHKKTWSLTLGKVVKFVTYGGILLLVANSLGGLGVAATPTPVFGSGPSTGLVPTTSWVPTHSTPYMQCMPRDFDPSSYGMPIIPSDALCISHSFSPGGCDYGYYSSPDSELPQSPIHSGLSQTSAMSRLPLETGSGPSTTGTGPLLPPTPDAPPTPVQAEPEITLPRSLPNVLGSTAETVPLPTETVTTTPDTGSASTSSETGTNTPNTGSASTSDPVTHTTQSSEWSWGTIGTLVTVGGSLYSLVRNVRDKGPSALLSSQTAYVLLEGGAAVLGWGSPIMNAGNYAMTAGNYAMEGAQALWALGTSTIGTPAMLVGTGLTTAAVVVGGAKAFSSPKIRAEDGQADMVTWKKPGVVTRSGYIYDIEVRGHKDLTKAEQDKLFDTFQEEMLEKYPRPIRIGDKLEFQIPRNETGKWNATLTPAKKNSAFYDLSDPTALRYEHSYTHSITSSDSVEKLEVLRDAMVRGSKISITCVQAPTVFPVSFTSADPNFSAAMQRLLSIPEMRKRMEESKHPELKKIAEEYRAMMERTKPRQPIDLSALEAQVKTNSKSSPAGTIFGRGRWVGEDRPINLKDGHTHDSDDWAMAIFRLMSSKGDKVEDLFARQQQFDPSKLDSSKPGHYTKTEFEGLWNDAEKQSTAYHRLSITPPSANSDGLAKLVKDKLTDSGTTQITQFDKAPDFIPIHIEGAIIPRDVPIDDLEIKPIHIMNSDKSVWYRLDNFSNDDSTITYRTTIELENGIPKKRYWKIDPKTHADPQRITLNQFKEAARTGRDFIYLKESNKYRVSESAILKKKDFVTKEINPQLKTIPIPITNPTGSAIPVSFEYAYVDSIPIIDAQAGSADGGTALYNAIGDLLDAAQSKGKTEITIPVPSGQGSNGPNWPIGIIWFAVQEYIRDNPTYFTSVTLAITRDETIERDQLIRAIDQADKICTRSPDAFDTFSPAWAKDSKPKRKGRLTWR